MKNPSFRKIFSGDLSDTANAVLYFFALWLGLSCVYRFGLVGLRGFVQGDLGLLVNVPWRILRGEIPYRDFYAGNYTPGSYYLHAALFKIFGRSISVLAQAQAFSQAVAVSLLTLSMKQYLTRYELWGGALLAVILSIPHENIPFPAVYTIALGLLTLVSLQRRWIFIAGVACGLIFTLKISAGFFVFAAAMWCVLAQMGCRKLATLWAWVIAALVLVLMRERLNLATLLMFYLPVFLFACVQHQLTVLEPRKDSRVYATCVGFLLPVLFVNLLWTLPFLKILGWQDFLWHFVMFPSRQAGVLYYPPVLPFLQGFGFEKLVRFRDSWKLWFYLPTLVSIVGIYRARRTKKFPVELLLFNILFALQLFPTIDWLHFKWVCPFSLLLLSALLPKGSQRRVIVGCAAVFLMLQTFYFADFFARKSAMGGYQKISNERVGLYYPVGDVAAVRQVAQFVNSQLAAGEIFWNPPGALFNFMLDRPYSLSTDYLGPKYLGDQAVAKLLQQVRENPPRMVIVPEVPEKDFGWESLTRNYPDIAVFIEANFNRQENIANYRIYRSR